MRASKLRLTVAAGLFFAWIAWLVYLASITRNPVILSRPQLLVSHFWVVGTLGEKGKHPAPEVKVHQVVWSARPKEKGPFPSQITLADLPWLGKEQGWAGPGDYILPLVESKEGKKVSYRVASLPPSPGFVPGFRTIRVLSTGKNKDEIINLAAQLSGLDRKEAGKILANLPGDLRKNLSSVEAEKIQGQLQAAGAIVALPLEESRIYQATPQALRQLEDLRPD